MDYQSSYAAGAPQLAHYAGTQPPAVDAAMVLPPPRPRRMHWSTLLFSAGMTICALGLLVTIAGVPGRMWYDPDSAPDRNKPNSNGPIALPRSIDGNMKWIAEASSDSEGAYVAYIRSINRKEAAIPAMVQALVTMDAAIRAIDTGLADVRATTSSMHADIGTMEATSAASGETMATLDGDIGFLSGSMLQLANSTQELTERMAAVERTTGAIATDGTGAARRHAAGLNASLPDEVPAATTSDGRPVAQVMEQLALGAAQ